MFCVIISAACTSLIAGACYDGAQGITSTDSSIGIAAGTWRNTVWTLTDSGLTLLAAKTGDLRRLDKNLLSGEGREVQLDVTNVAEMKANIMAEIAIGKIMNDVSFPSNVAPVFGSVIPKRKPIIRGGKTIDLGMSGGHRVSMQLSVEPRANKKPPSSALTLVDGRNPDRLCGLLGSTSKLGGGRPRRSGFFDRTAELSVSATAKDHLNWRWW